MTHHRRHLDRARPVDDEPPVGRGPERERGPPHPGELELGAIPLASGRELDAGRDPARVNSGPLPAVPRLERIESPRPGHAEREPPVGRRRVPDAPRPRGRIEELRPGEREIDALPHRRHRARDGAERLKMPRRLGRGLPFVRDRPLEPPRPTRAKRREHRRRLPRGRRLAFRVEREDHIPVIVRHRRPHRPQHRRPGRRDDRWGQRLEVA